MSHASNSDDASSVTRHCDAELLLLLRDGRTLTVEQMMASLGVTATAIRQRVERLLAAELLRREKRVCGRGRPTYCYSLTVTGLRQAGGDTAAFAESMWSEIMLLSDSPVRRRLVSAIAKRLGKLYAPQGGSLEEKMKSLTASLARNQIDASVHQAKSETHPLPVLDIEACPYPTLREASGDRTLCKMEEEMFSVALGAPMQLVSCRLDGDACCQFSPVTTGNPK